MSSLPLFPHCLNLALEPMYPLYGHYSTVTQCTSLTSDDLLPGEVGAALGGPLDDVGEADAVVETPAVVLGGERPRDQAREEHALPY